MPTISFRLPDGTVRTVEAKEGESLMRAAVNNDIDEIEGECGGEISCATCHVYLSENLYDELAAPSRDENELLEVMDTFQPHRSRLGCQVYATPILDQVEVEVAPPEY